MISLLRERVQFIIGKLRSHKLCGVAKLKKIINNNFLRLITEEEVRDPKSKNDLHTTAGLKMEEATWKRMWVTSRTESISLLMAREWRHQHLQLQGPRMNLEVVFPLSLQVRTQPANILMSALWQSATRHIRPDCIWKTWTNKCTLF